VFAGAAELAGVAPGEIFFVDDTAGHVAAARSAGFDAVQYTTTQALAADLRSRGLEFNY
jgi:FMN phosphatase YigB (HAD superfamily)